MPLLGVQPVGAGVDSGISLALFTASSVFPPRRAGTRSISDMMSRDFSELRFGWLLTAEAWRRGESCVTELLPE
jgi:hypothetical protein